MMDALILILITLACMCLTLRKTVNIESEHYDFLNEYLLSQSKAMRYRENVTLNKENSVYFNESGHVNKGASFMFGKHKVIIHLGNGYITYE